jgi:hypothetical protein
MSSNKSCAPAACQEDFPRLLSVGIVKLTVGISMPLGQEKIQRWL